MKLAIGFHKAAALIPVGAVGHIKAGMGVGLPRCLILALMDRIRCAGIGLSGAMDQVSGARRGIVAIYNCMKPDLVSTLMTSNPQPRLT